MTKWMWIALLFVLGSCAYRPDGTAPTGWQVFFSPRGGCTEAVVDVLERATNSVLVQAYSFTSAPIARAIVEAQRRHVQVAVILDKSQRSEKYSSADFLRNSGVATFIDATHAIAALLTRVSDWFPDRALRLHAMHHFPVGGDDRIYARRLARLVGNGRCLVDNTPRTPTETLSIMAEASLVIAMRFHSVVFAHTIGAPMVAIDYTDGGKVTDYLSEHDLAERRLTFADLARIGRQDLIQRGLGMETARP